MLEKLRRKGALATRLRDSADTDSGYTHYEALRLEYLTKILEYMYK